ncbi:hypothetical protein DYH09_23450 [bacterium CPR1]|nr:hypothetical protein [bacterium CPR1]
MNARTFLDPAQAGQVSRAIAAAEKRTSAEIVCAVASESGRYDRAEGILGLVGALFALSLLQVLFQGDAWEPKAVPLAYQGAGVVLGYLLGNALGSFFPALRAPFVGPREMLEETARAAWHVFAERRLGSTRKGGGVLIYLSLFERRVVVLADRGAALSEDELKSLRDLALEQLRQGKRLEALTAPIEAVGELLSTRLPYQEDDQNELPDELLILHPRP